MFVCWIWLVPFLLPCIVWCYNIALHAQVFPDGEKVVGSVITTDGLRAAFLKRREVEKCEIFYPGHYHGYSNTTWDFLIIEGWFLNIYEFLQVSRNLFPDMKIFFYCLDPVYPGMSQVVKFNVDGIVSNSQPLRKALSSMGDSFTVYYACCGSGCHETEYIDFSHLWSYLCWSGITYAVSKTRTA